MRIPTLVIALICSTIACETDDAGEAPTIESASFDASAVRVGEQSMMSGIVEFTDADGDVESVELEIGPPSGAPLGLSTPAVGASGMTAGSLQVVVSLIAPTAGRYGVVVRLHDAEGHASPPYESEFTLDD